jgi:hypothetical protein
MEPDKERRYTNVPAGMDHFNSNWADEPRHHEETYSGLCDAIDELPTSLFAGTDFKYRMTWKGRIKLRRLGQYKAYNGQTMTAYIGSNKQLYNYNPLKRGFGRFPKLWPGVLMPSEQRAITRLLNSAM